jgi:hypothetical protein
MNNSEELNNLPFRVGDIVKAVATHRLYLVKKIEFPSPLYRSKNKNLRNVTLMIIADRIGLEQANKDFTLLLFNPDSGPLGSAGLKKVA